MTCLDTALNVDILVKVKTKSVWKTELLPVHDFSVFDMVLMNIWSIMGKIQKFINALF